MVVTEAPYGSWKSPLSSKIACDASVSMNGIAVDVAVPDKIFWSELRPSEDGRFVLFSLDIKEPLAAPVRWTSAEYNASSKVHEYGGAAYTPKNGKVYFINAKDQCIYVQTLAASPQSLTDNSIGHHRYSDMVFSNDCSQLVCVQEDHSVVPSRKEPQNCLACINTETKQKVVLCSGADFYSCPRFSGDGSKLAWMQWYHPNMPWDDTEIWVADAVVKDGFVQLTNEVKIGGEPGVNFMEPSWTCDGRLLFISDKTGWWNLYIVDDLRTSECRNVYRSDEEIGSPMWTFRHLSFSPHPTDADLVATLYGQKPSIVSIKSGLKTDIDVGFWLVFEIAHSPDGLYLLMMCYAPNQPECILRHSLSDGESRVIYQTSQLPVDAGYLSIPEKISFPTEGGCSTAHGYYYPPANKDFSAPAGTLPPLLVKIHGGPTSCADLSIDLGKQYFTSRGFAILDVDYRGSTGYGTSFRTALRNKWGVHDIEDACSGAQYLVKLGRVHKDKLVIDGRSAGGYTTIACVTFRDTFRCGACHYGISDLEVLAKETHKFESRYTDVLIGPYPEGREIYIERSPLHFIDKMNTPVAFFHGELDKVVPPNQAKMMFDELKKKGLPCSLVLFPDEGHGFRKSENQRKALDGEFYFFSRVLGFEPADSGIQIPIENV